MRSRCHRIAGVVLLIFLACPSGASLAQTKRAKSVWNYDGGVFLKTDGSLPNGVCFRVSGRLDSPEFFDDLKRVDSVIHDQPCASGLKQIGTRIYLTREMMSSLKLSLYWKHGVDLRAVGNVAEKSFSVEPIAPYDTSLSSELPKRFEWAYQLAIPGKGVPLTDSLVLVFRAPGDRIAARVAARL